MTQSQQWDKTWLSQHLVGANIIATGGYWNIDIDGSITLDVDQLISIGGSQGYFAMTASGLDDTVTVNTTNGALTAYTLDADIHNWNIGLTGAQDNLVTLSATGLNGQVVVLGAGNDTITGSSGSDTISTGAGIDRIYFNSLTGTDTIADYNVANDTIYISGTVFTAWGASRGVLNSNDFVSGVGVTATSAVDGSDYILYNTSNGNLWYDVDGSGVQEALLIGIITSAPALTTADFIVY